MCSKHVSCNVYRQLVSEYKSWVSRVRVDTAASSWQERHGAVIELCLLLDGIGRCAQVW
jgi:hypothetical protein